MSILEEYGYRKVRRPRNGMLVLVRSRMSRKKALLEALMLTALLIACVPVLLFVWPLIWGH